MTRESVPVALWQYSNRNNNSYFVGREWELSQLEQLQYRSQTKGVVACVFGKKGMGKSHLIRHFLKSPCIISSNTLYIAPHDGMSYSSVFVHHLLKLPLGASSNLIRKHVTAIVKSPLVYLYILTLLGVDLTKSELSALQILSEKRCREVEVLSIMVMITQLVEQRILVVAFDELQDIGSVQFEFVRLLVTHAKEQSLLILLAGSNTDKLYGLPKWLRACHMINLSPLDKTESTKLAQWCFNSCEHKLSSMLVEESVLRSEGNPLYLIWQYQYKKNELAGSFTALVDKMRTPLTQQQNHLLDFMAQQGCEVQEDTVESYLLTNQRSKLSDLTTLIMVGFIEPTFKSYTFQHPLLCEVIQSQLGRRSSAQISHQGETLKRA
nr:ATP-binding protein [Vibrio pectenicida]